MSTKLAQVRELTKRVGVLRPSDLGKHGLPEDYLCRLYRRGELVRVGRGLYSARDLDMTECHDLVEAVKRVPNSVVCLLSALRFHGLTTQNPHQVWLARARGAANPQAELSVRVLWFSEAAFREGVERHEVEGVELPVYSVAKTVADCFKYRNKLGLDVALEALREGWREKRLTMDELWRYAKVCRVAEVIRPYLETLR
jgi:predicted transcriptional regulator of viral defense system